MKKPRSETVKTEADLDKAIDELTVKRSKRQARLDRKWRYYDQSIIFIVIFGMIAFVVADMFPAENDIHDRTTSFAQIYWGYLPFVLLFYAASHLRFKLLNDK